MENSSQLELSGSSKSELIIIICSKPFLVKSDIFKILKGAKFRDSELHEFVHLGMRLAIGVIFIVQGTGKFNPGFTGFLTNMGLPIEMQIPISYFIVNRS